MTRPTETTFTSPKGHTDRAFTCKIIPDRDELPTSGKQWSRAKRCTLHFQEGGLKCGNISISYSDIQEARIHIYQSALFFEYGILSIQSGGKTHHFGITYTDYWKSDLPFAVERMHEESPYIFLRRTVIVMIIAYLFWEVIKI